MGKNFITLSKKGLEDILPGNFEEIETKAGEVVYDLPTEVDNLKVRVYSSVDKKTGETREKGTDAIRIVFWDDLNKRPLGKARKILRVEGATRIEDRIRDRIELFLSLKKPNIADYKLVEKILKVTHGDFASSLLSQLKGSGSLSETQLAYVLGDKNPKNKPTFEYYARKYHPEVFEKPEPVEPEKPAEPVEPEKPFHGYNRAIHGDTGAVPAEVVKPEVKNPEEVELISTKEHKSFKYPFDFFNPVQSQVFPEKKNDVNIVVGANTSAGKTICAEIVMDEVLKEGKRVVYLSPLKSLTQEKYEDWQKRFPDKEICIMTGDYSLSPKMMKKVNEANIIVMTSEMMDSRTRKMKTEKNFWLLQVGLVIVDESHILTTERGHAVEVGLMRFTKLNNKARIILLSATMPNTDELGKWCSILNGKETKVINCNWRPVELQMNYIEYSPVNRDYQATQAVKRSCVIDCVMAKPDEKFLVFVHDKGTGRILEREFNSRGERALFHNADLNLNERLEVEKDFQSRKKDSLRILISTSTLAWGSINIESEITMANGIKKLAGILKAGDRILSYNEKTGELEQDTILNVENYDPEFDLEIELEDGRTIRVDKKHPFYVRTENGIIQKEAQYLTEDDDLVIDDEL